MSEPAPIGLLLCRDLIFTAKITGTARALGREILVAGGAERAAAWIEGRRPRVVFVDLAAGDLTAPQAVTHLRSLAPDTPFVAFGSHVDTTALAAARAAGCDPVLPRSRFVAELASLIRHHLGEATPQAG